MKVEIKEFFGNEWVVAIGTSLILALLYAIRRKIHNCRNRRKVFLWLKDNTKDKAGEQFKSTTEISKGLDIDEEQISNTTTILSIETILFSMSFLTLTAQHCLYWSA
jgi:hypothetical protein